MDSIEQGLLAWGGGAERNSWHRAIHDVALPGGYTRTSRCCVLEVGIGMGTWWGEGNRDKLNLLSEIWAVLKV